MAAITPTLTGMSSLGLQQSEEYAKNSNLVVLPFPLEEDTSSEVFGLTGATATIILRGKFTGAIDTLNVPLAELRVIANPDPSATSTYTSNMFPSGIGVTVLSVRSTLVVGSQSTLDYEIKMAVGTVIT